MGGAAEKVGAEFCPGIERAGAKGGERTLTLVEKYLHNNVTFASAIEYELEIGRHRHHISSIPPIVYFFEWEPFVVPFQPYEREERHEPDVVAKAQVGGNTPS